MGNQMNRILLILILFSACLMGCSKSNDVVAQVNAQEAIDAKLITAYLKNNNINAKVIDSSGVSTGIYYTIDTAATGNALFTSSTSVTVSYTGQLLTNGTLGSAFATSGTTFHPSFILGSVIRGWQLGIPYSNIGGTITLYLPSNYAYGPYPQPELGLPANAILVFVITIYNVTN
jgi:FKBP-type peptidyl-prolyl cis-trans isomerase FkpA